MREMSPYILENWVKFSPVLFDGFGQKPGFENQKWAEKFGGIF